MPAALHRIKNKYTANISCTHPQRHILVNCVFLINHFFIEITQCFQIYIYICFYIFSLVTLRVWLCLQMDYMHYCSCKYSSCIAVLSVSRSVR